jgi:hypothetical protein
MTLEMAKQVLHSDLALQSLHPQSQDSPVLSDNVIIIDIGDGARAGEQRLDPADSLSALGEVQVAPPRTLASTRKGARGKASKRTNVSRTQRPSNNGLPQMSANPKLTYTFRYKTTGDGNVNVKVSDLARSMVAASSSNSFRYLFRTVKLEHVAIRAAASSVGESATVKLQFLGENTDETTYMDSTMRIDHNACVSRRPPKFSLASFWHDVTSSTDNEKSLFNVSTSTAGGADTYVDVTIHAVYDEQRYIDYVISNNSLSGLNAGGLYYGNLSEGSPNFVPVARVALGL